MERLCEYEPEYLELTSPNQYVYFIISLASRANPSAAPSWPRSGLIEANHSKVECFLFTQLQACSRGGTCRAI